MKILKYKDNQGNWVSVPALIGPKGDQGIQGEKGDRGDTVIIASKYSELTFPVAEGTYCLYNDVPYVANQTISTSEAWTAAHWDQVSFEDEIGELKNALQAYEGGTTGQVLRKKSNADNDVEWASVAQPTDEQVADAVDGYLDAHPEQTTTVMDGSLTEAKFTDPTQLKVLNYYVTPEMFGAKGDGTTNDTQAIKNMLASENVNFRFSNKTYKVSDSIDVSKICTLYFDNTTIQVTRDHTGVRSFEYILGIKARVKTIGKLTLNGDRSVNVCLWLSQCGGSYFDQINVALARIWGVCTDSSHADLNSLKFNKIGAEYCGFRVEAKCKYVSNGSYEITDISNGNFSGWTYETYNSVFDNRYGNARIIVDDSGYTGSYLFNRAVMRSNAASPFTLNENSPTSGTFTKEGSYAGFPSDYKNGDNGRPVIIMIGGGLNFSSSASEGLLEIGTIVTQNCSISMNNELSYGGKISSYASEYDGILLTTGILYAFDIGYLYLEALGQGYKYAFNNAYDKIMLVCANDATNVTITNPFIGTGRIKFAQANEVLLNSQYSQNDVGIVEALICPDFMAKNAFNNPYVERATGGFTITEESPRRLVHGPTYLSSGNTIKLKLNDIKSYRRNQFGPFEYYCKVENPNNGHILKIGMDSSLSSNGYSINGAVDNVLSIDTSEYGNFLKVTIVLIRKVFYVKAEALTFVTNNI